jgi:hypothetical protein
LTESDQEAPAAEGSLAHFRGWIPTVSGRLSFSVFGNTTFPSATTRANIADPDHRFFLAYQRHDLSDAIIPFIAGHNGRCVLLVLAHTEDDAAGTQFYLQGRAFIFFDLKRWESILSGQIRQHADYMELYATETRITLYDHVFTRHVDLIDLCTKDASFYADIRISRRGTTDIVVPLPNATNSSVPQFPSNTIRFDNFLHRLAAQLFFFLKNIGHRHQHHEPGSDTIVDLHRILNGDDITWRQNTLYSMYRTVIEYKRNPHFATFNNALGIIAYATTFTELCYEEKPEIEGKNILPKYYGENTVKSIVSTQAGEIRKRDDKRRRLDILRTTLLGITALVVSYAGLVRLAKPLDVEPDPLLLGAITFALRHTFWTIAITAAIIVVVMWVLRVRDEDRQSASTQFIVRLLQPFRRVSVVAGLVILVILFVFSFFVYL